LKSVVAVALALTVTAVIAQDQAQNGGQNGAQQNGGQGAQGGGGQGRRNRGGGGGGMALDPLRVLTNDTVQKDLELSDDQKTQVAKLADDQAAQRGQNRGAGGFDPTAFQQRRDEEMKKIDEILLQPQQDRLAEIMLQLQGASTALADAKVADKLSLTGDQKDKLTALNDEYRQKFQDLIQNLRQNGGGGGGGAGRGAFNSPEFAAAMKEHNDKALDVLTADQKAQYEKMEGKKIDVDPASLRGRGRRGGAGGGNAQPAA
jgi:hypothetical protein